jgi:hypothetical protein
MRRLKRFGRKNGERKIDDVSNWIFTEKAGRLLNFLDAFP